MEFSFRLFRIDVLTRNFDLGKIAEVQLCQEAKLPVPSVNVRKKTRKEEKTITDEDGIQAYGNYNGKQWYIIITVIFILCTIVNHTYFLKD